MKEYEVCDYRYDEGFRTRVETGIMPTITTHQHDGGGLSACSMAIEKTVRIRKLTPRECWRLMGFTDEDFDKASKVVSDTQLYKQAGNSIVVDVLCSIFGAFFEDSEE